MYLIEGLKNWAQGIVIAIIIGTILEMILPENNNKKYIKTVIGLYIVFTIISPVISNIMGGNIKIENYIDVEKYATVSGYANYEQTILLENDSKVEDVYIKTLKQDISAKIKQKGYYVSDIKIDIETSSKEKYGEILGIYIWISESKVQENVININSVNVVEINVSATNSANTNTKVSDVSEGKINEIKEFLNNTYGIEKSKIHRNE